MSTESKTISSGLQLAKVWGPILAFGIGIGIGYAGFNSRLAVVEAKVSTIESSRAENLPTFNIMAAQFVDMRADVAWLKANMYQLLIKQSVQPVDPNIKVPLINTTK